MQEITLISDQLLNFFLDNICLMTVIVFVSSKLTMEIELHHVSFKFWVVYIQILINQSILVSFKF